MLLKETRKTFMQAIRPTVDGKRNVILTGTILSPIKREERALITVSGRVIQTSTVVDLLEAASGYVKFETRNTIYTVFHPAPSDDTEVCA